MFHIIFHLSVRHGKKPDILLTSLNHTRIYRWAIERRPKPPEGRVLEFWCQEVFTPEGFLSGKLEVYVQSHRVGFKSSQVIGRLLGEQKIKKKKTALSHWTPQGLPYPQRDLGSEFDAW